jgi:hypothetical protein
MAVAVGAITKAGAAAIVAVIAAQVMACRWLERFWARRYWAVLLHRSRPTPRRHRIIMRRRRHIRRGIITSNRIILPLATDEIEARRARMTEWSSGRGIFAFVSSGCRWFVIVHTESLHKRFAAMRVFGKTSMDGSASGSQCICA